MMSGLMKRRRRALGGGWSGSFGGLLKMSELD